MQATIDGDDSPGREGKVPRDDRAYRQANVGRIAARTRCVQRSIQALERAGRGLSWDSHEKQVCGDDDDAGQHGERARPGRAHRRLR